MTANLTGHSPDDETARWFADNDDKLHSKLARPDLVESRKANGATLKTFLTEDIESRTDVIGRTRNNYWQAANFLIEFFGKGHRLDRVNPGDGDQWRVWLLERVAENTARRHCGRASSFFGTPYAGS